MLIATLKQLKSILTRFFIPGLLFRILQLKPLNLEIYHFRIKLWNNIAIFVSTKTTLWMVTRL